jgi:Coenzyme PQQ synthesis protein D (PqqD)
MTATASFEVAADVYWRDAPGELLLFDARTERYCVLNEPAAAVWRRLAAGAALDEIATELARHFGADRATVLADVAGAVGDFLRHDLLVPTALG